MLLEQLKALSASLLLAAQWLQCQEPRSDLSRNVVLPGSAAVDVWDEEPVASRRLLVQNRIAGVGTAIFIWFFFLAFTLLCCALLTRVRTFRWFYYALTASMLITVTLVLFASPKGQQRDKPPEGWDKTIIPMTIIMIFMCLGILLGALSLLFCLVFQTRYARPLNYHVDVLMED